MRHRIAQLALALAAVCLLVGTASAQSEVWKNDPPHSFAYFEVFHNHVNYIRGTFSKMNIVVTYDPKDVAKTSIDGTIDVASINTDVAARDKDLLSPNYFDVAKFPTMTFKTTKVATAGKGKLKMTGDLTIHGVTKQVVFNVTGPTPIWVDERQPNAKKTHMGAMATTTINRKDFGITMNELVGDDVQITMSMDLVEQAPTAVSQAGPR